MLEGMQVKITLFLISILVPGGRYEDILQLCGELCDLSKPIKRTAGDLLGMGTVTAKVSFPSLKSLHMISILTRPMLILLCY